MSRTDTDEIVKKIADDLTKVERQFNSYTQYTIVVALILLSILGYYFCDNLSQYLNSP